MEESVIIRMLRYIFIEDYAAKLICLAIGSGLWFYVEFARVTQTTFNVPVEYVKKPANLFLRQGQARFVKITVRGRDEFLKFSTTGIKAEINLLNARSGEASYPLVFDTRQLPERVELAQRPETMQVALEKGSSKTIPIHVITSGNPDAAWRLFRTVASPAEIEIDGPEALVNGMLALDTEPVDIEGTTKSFTKKINLRIPDQVATDKIKNVSVRVDLIQKTFSEEAQFEQIALRVQNLDAALEAALSDKTVQIRVQGESAALKKLKASDFYAFVNAEDTRFNARTGNILPYATESGVQVKARVISGGKKVQVISVTPDKINIRFTVRPEYVKKSTPEGITP